MIQILACLLVVALVAGDAPECGDYSFTCLSVPFNGTMLQATGKLRFDGVTSGLFYYEYNLFLSGCGTTPDPDLIIIQNGTWTDLGFSKNTSSQPDDRSIMIYPQQIRVTPVTPNMTAYLMATCKCMAGASWSTGVQRLLTACPQSYCLDTTWLGLYGLPGRDGIIIGKPAFGNFQAPPGEFAISALSWNYTTGFNQDVNTSISYTQTRACADPVPIQDMCGTYAIDCMPAFNKSYGSFRQVWSYFGTSSFVSGDGGEYTLTLTTFEDDGCTKPHMISYERGIASNVGHSNGIPNGYVLEKMAPMVNITPMTMSAVIELKNACPCGGTWQQGIARTLYSCLVNTCNNTAWNRGNTIGMPQYAGYISQTLQDPTAISQQFRITEFSNTLKAAQDDTLLNTRDVAMTRIISCPSTLNSTNDFCGSWSLPCAANPDGLGEDFSLFYSMEGDLIEGTSLSSGIYTRTYTTYAVGSTCSANQASLMIYEMGLFAEIGMEPSGASLGARVVQMNVPRVQATPYTQTMATHLNLVCPCGGNWTAGQTRTIASCLKGSCDNVNLFGNGVLGVPGFGIMQKLNGNLRISKLSSNLSSLNPLDQNAYSIPLSGNCNPAPVSEIFCGEWKEACRQEPYSGLDYYGHFWMTANGSYFMSRHDYLPGNDCVQDYETLVVRQYGKITVSSQASVAVPDGRMVTVNPYQMEITPLTFAAVNNLTLACPCGGTWAINVTRTFTKACPALTCNDTTWLRQPIGVTSYGNFRKYFVFLRMTYLNADKHLGWNTSLTAYDFPYAQWNNSQCDAIPQNDDSKGKPISGGSIVLIIFFVLAFVYFAGGIGYNYVSTGNAVLPNASFWGSLPGLIGDGLRFSILECFGLNSSGHPYKQANFNSDLNTTSNERSGYGTL